MAEPTTDKKPATPVASEDWYAHDGRTDIYVGMRSVHVWAALGWHDIRQRYRRSVLGPFWFTLSTFIMIGVLGFLYSTLLNQEIQNYLPFLGVGLVLWQYLSTSLLESANGLIGAGYLIKQIRMPLSVHICRIVWRNFSILLHSLPVVMLFSFALGHYPSANFLLIIPGLFLLMLTGVWMGLVLAILCLRFRDILPIVTNLLQVAFFFTPIMWSPDMLQERAWIAHFNPIYHLIEIVRAPMIGLPIQIESWAWSIGMVIAGFIIAQMLMKATQHKVAYWL